jgi:hypothetical protein
MAKKKWIDWKNEDCPNCGNGVEVCTDAQQEDIFPVAYDGDAAQCNSCGWEGNLIVDEDGARLNGGNLDEL